MIDPLEYYSPETLAFPGIAARFAASGCLTAEELYLILDWKAARARTRQHKKLVRLGGTFASAAERIGNQLYAATDGEARLKLLMTEWEFLLPTAAAILTVLYPDVFTMYDVRVCAELGDFGSLGNQRWSPKLCTEYQRFVVDVQAAVPAGLPLRDADRWLWGRNKQRIMLGELHRS